VETQRCWLPSGESSILRYPVEHHLAFVKMCVLFVFLFFNYCNLSLSLSLFSSFLNTFPQLKKKLQILTLGIGGVGLVSAYFSYSPEIAARYANFVFVFYF
jgi:hypothetical protein